MIVKKDWERRCHQPPTQGGFRGTIFGTLLLIPLFLFSCISIDQQKLDEATVEMKRLNNNLESYKPEIKKIADSLEKLAKRFDEVMKLVGESK